MQRVEIKALGGCLLIVPAAAIVSFAAYALTVTDHYAPGGSYMIIGGLMFIGITVLLAVVGGRMVRPSLRIFAGLVGQTTPPVNEGNHDSA